MKPRIGMVTDHFCVRVVKEARILLNAGYEVSLISNAVGFGIEQFTASLVWGTQAQLSYALQHSSAEILHVHNEPDWLAEQVLTMKRPDQAMVWDIHDLETARWNSTPLQERNIIAQVDGLVHISPTMRDLTLQCHGYRCPEAIIPCAVPKAWYRDPDGQREGFLVYEGGVDFPLRGYQDAQANNPQMKAFSMRDWGIMAKACQQAGRSMALFSGSLSAEIGAAYRQMGVMTGRRLGYHEELFTHLGRYQWGLCGIAWPSELMDRALPNKFFEYMAAGTPVLVYHGREMEAWAQAHGVGVSLRKPEIQSQDSALETKKAIACVTEFLEGLTRQQRDACQEQVMKKRESWSMERWLPDLEELYQNALAYHKGKG